MGLCHSVAITVPWVPGHGEGLEPALLPALRAGQGLLECSVTAGVAWHRTRDPWARLWGLLKSSPGHTGCFRTPAAPAACPAPSPGKRALPGAGQGREQPCCHSWGSRFGSPSPGVMTSVLRLCRCHHEGSLGWGSESGSAIECRPAGSASGCLLETPPRSSQSLLPLLPSSTGLIPERKGSQASLNALRGNLHLFYEHQNH